MTTSLLASSIAEHWTSKIIIHTDNNFHNKDNIVQSIQHTVSNNTINTLISLPSGSHGWTCVNMYVSVFMCAWVYTARTETRPLSGVHAVCTDNTYIWVLCNSLRTSCVETLMYRTQKDPGHFPSVVENKYTSGDNQAAAGRRDTKPPDSLKVMLGNLGLQGRYFLLSHDTQYFLFHFSEEIIRKRRITKKVSKSFWRK